MITGAESVWDGRILTRRLRSGRNGSDACEAGDRTAGSSPALRRFGMTRASNDFRLLMISNLKEWFMCPACVASAGVVVGSVVSTGGLSALVLKVLRKKKGEKSDSKEKE